ncbi:hypothetical protein NPIL_547031 [Nephila pilipes]|uniref:Uncharacterized protein n=1 Tax=Nephila pilipes TaxID=299642 RepID=A0A8X6MG09_NEPPI|nr:hypothetical protein NPIL_547031 [Nephila pilipes]
MLKKISETSTICQLYKAHLISGSNSRIMKHKNKLIWKIRYPTMDVLFAYFIRTGYHKFEVFIFSSSSTGVHSLS